MGVKQCAECGETADDAKAFCPSCGNAFVDEQTRSEPSKFEQLDGTMQFGQTMYNQMLSDMGLNLKAPQKQAAQTLKPIVESVKPAAPAATPAVKVDVPSQGAKKEPKSRNRLIVVALVAAFLVLLLIVAVLVGLALWWRLG